MIVYKIIIILTALTILNYILSVCFIFLFIVILVIFYYYTDLQEFDLEKVTNLCLKVRNDNQEHCSSNFYRYCSKIHSIPAMQNSRFNKNKSTFSPISNGTNGMSRILCSNITSSTSQLRSSTYVQNSIFSPPRITPVRSPPRYSLSESSTSKPTNSTNKATRPVQNISGPLLASTRFNVSLGTYTDTKSPGLSSRIVQYSNEAKEKRTPTHQTKYGSPGLFPVVHFFKKDLPVISPKPKKVTVRIASPDVAYYTSPKFCKDVSGDVSKIKNDKIQENDRGTRSVLDALKEISRKRIHTSPEYESSDDTCKRQKCFNSNNTYEYNKRNREDSPIQEVSNVSTSPVEPSAKKCCVVDLLAASFTSSQLLKEQMEKGLKKRKSDADDSKKEQKQIKLTNAETQTIDIETKTETEKTVIQEKNTEHANLLKLPENNADIVKNDKVTVTDTPENNVENRRFNMFNEERLEIRRKNKLAVLLSAITGSEPKLIPYNSLGSDETLKAENKLVSIISPQNKPKHDKHVSFNLPPEDKLPTTCIEEPLPVGNSITSTVIISSVSSTPTNDTAVKFSNVINSETPKSTLPSSVATKLAFGSTAANTDNKVDGATKPSNTVTVSSEPLKINSSHANLPLMVIPIISSNDESNTADVLTNSFSLIPHSNTSNTNQLFSFGSTTSVATISTCTSLPPKNQEFNFGAKPTSSVSPSINLSVPPKVGGFKYDLNKSTTNAPNKISNMDNKPSVISTANSLVSTFAFGAPQNVSSTSDKPFFGSNVPNSNSNMQGFGVLQSAVPTTNTFPFGSNNSSNKPVHFDAAAPITSTNSLTSIAFVGGNISSTSVLSFGKPSLSFSIANTAGSFNTISTTSALNANPISTPAFGSNNTIGFGSPNATTSNKPSLSTFGVTSAPSFGTANATATFGTNSSVFGTGNTFGTTITTNSSTFGSGGFGNTISTVSPFSSNSANTSAFGNVNLPFGSATTPASNVFGTNSIKTAPGFGVTTAAPAFGTNTVTSASFNTNSATPQFGSNAANTSAFGSVNPNSGPAFGSSTSNTPGYVNPNTTGTPGTTFGSNATNTSSFGLGTTTSSSVFGTNAVTSKPFNFGSTNTTNGPVFGNNAGSTFNFPVTTSPSVFNTNKSVPSFGPTFGSSTNPNGPFAPTQVPTCTVPVTSTNIFGSSTSTFGNGGAAFGTKAESTFGTKAESTFGTKAESTFGTGFGNNNAPTFGSSANNNFGSSGTFGANTGNNQSFGSGFGTVDANSAFAKSQNISNVFGNAVSSDASFQFGSTTTGGVNSTQPTFGSTNPSGNVPTQAGVFAFGPAHQPAPVTAASVFSFGTNEAPKPNFNFSSGSNSLPPFAAASPTFGATPNTNFNPNITQFPSPSATMFSIGSGTSTRTRTHLKAKRRT